MPIPVTVPSVPIAITDEETARAELFLTELVGIIKNGTTGGSPALQTPAMLVPDNPNPSGLVALDIDTAEKQLMFRQTALALVKTCGVLVRTADSAAIPVGAGVYYSGNNIIAKGDCSSPTKTAIFGVAMETIAGLSTGRVANYGVVEGVLLSATAGTKYFMGAGGLPVLVGAVASGSRLIQLGSARNATDLEIHIQDLGVQP
jgi:hypothetical protein